LSHALKFSFFLLFSFRKGIAGSAIPYRRRAPTWLKTTPEEVSTQICKLARKGLTPSAIGVQLRDSHGVGQIKNVTGSKVLRILKANGKNQTMCYLFLIVM
tara:strand:- start:96 stop:398 length:303 start_codon:yes stop_codon:yes gene_type:complete